MKNTLQFRQRQLIETGVYDVRSLRLNLQGNQSRRQRVKLMIHAYLWFSLSWINTIGLVGLIALEIIYFKAIPSLFFWVIAFGVLGFLNYRHALPFWKDIQENKVQAVSGEITKKYYFVSGGRYGGGDSFFTVRVQSVVFSVSPTLYSSLVDGERYRLFYAPNSKWVLNVDTTS